MFLSLKNVCLGLLLALFPMLFPYSGSGQGLAPAPGIVFDDAALPRIDFYLDPDSLDALYDDPFSDGYYRAQFVFTRGGYRDSVGNIGFRCRGNFSRGAAKKNFKVSFNTFEAGRKWNGLEKMNLNGQANDPSVIRAKLASDLIPDMGTEGTRANHCRVYINEDFYGLYINVEHIDEQFAQWHFGSDQGNLYKCTYPVDLVWQGSNPTSYDYCEWTHGGDRAPYLDLVEFVDVLNNTPSADLACALEDVFNVDDYLRQAAIDVMIGNWDGYIYNKNNLYLFHNPVSDRIEYMIYDTDNTYGIDWIGRDWGTRNIYTWQNSSEYRPLFERLLDNPEYRARYSWYINRLSIQVMAEPEYFARIDELKTLINTAAEEDPYRPLDHGFSIEDFHDSYTMALGGHVEYGLKPYVSTRISNALGQLEAYDMAPVLNHLRHNYPVLNQVPHVTVFAEDDGPSPQVWLVYSLDGTQDSVMMADDGASGDRDPGDGIFGASLDAIDIAVDWSFRIHAYGADGRATKRPCDPVSWQIDLPAIPLFINEFMADNAGYMSDENGEFADWLEIFNAGAEPVYLGNKYLSDNPELPSRWRMPDLTLPAGGFAWFWADDDEEDGPNHTNFRLNASGGSIGIYSSEEEQLYPVHVLQYGIQAGNLSSGLFPDAGEFQELSVPTPGWSNVLTSINTVESSGVQVFPNPARDRVYLGPTACTSWIIQGMEGRIWRSFSTTGDRWLDLTGIPPGVYLLSGTCNQQMLTVRLVVQ